MKERLPSTARLESIGLEGGGVPEHRRRGRFSKRIAALCFSALWLPGQVIVDAVRRLLGARGGRCVVLYYHGVSDAQRSRFERQMAALVRATVPVNPATDERPLNGRACSMVTFDDGFRSVVDNALPALMSHGITAAMFVPSASLGARPIWLAGLDHEDYRREVVLSAAELALFADHMVIGSHTRTHRRLTGLPRSEIRLELAESKRELEAVIGREVDLLSFPHGDHDARVLRMAREVGYRRVFTIRPKSTRLDDFFVDRYLASPDDWALEFALKIRGGYSWMWGVQRLKRRLARLVCGRAVVAPGQRTRGIA